MINFNPMSYLRRKVSEAVLGGFSDAVNVLVPNEEPQPANVDELRQLVAAAVQPKSLPAPATTPDDEDEAEPAKRKARKS